jgi:hypothetical protein
MTLSPNNSPQSSKPQLEANIIAPTLIARSDQLEEQVRSAGFEYQK